MKLLLLSCIAVLTSGVNTTLAQHTVLAKAHVVVLDEPVMAEGKLLPAGMYELRILEERPVTTAGDPSNTQRIVEFAQHGIVVAREVAEVFPNSQTGVAAAPTKARVQRLREDDFVRVSVIQNDSRFLIYLSTAPPGAVPHQTPQQP
jgi:hypothetical protein